jgi:hypothetical protein
MSYISRSWSIYLSFHIFGRTLIIFQWHFTTSALEVVAVAEMWKHVGSFRQVLCFPGEETTSNCCAVQLCLGYQVVD